MSKAEGACGCGASASLLDRHRRSILPIHALCNSESRVGKNHDSPRFLTMRSTCTQEVVNMATRPATKENPIRALQNHDITGFEALEEARYGPLA